MIEHINKMEALLKRLEALEGGAQPRDIVGELEAKLAIAVDALKSIESLGKSSDVACIASEALGEIE